MLRRRRNDDGATTRMQRSDARPGDDARVQRVRRRQLDEFGGFSLTAAFFGWLVALAIAALLTAVVAAAGAAIGLTADGVGSADAEKIGLAGGVLLVAVLLLAYYAGGYVAGRLSRFDGGRQGFGVWAFGLLTTLVIAAAGAIGGSEYNVLSRFDLPRIPVDEGDLATGGAIVLGVVLVGTLLAAIAGGRGGERYHLAVDRAGLADDGRRAHDRDDGRAGHDDRVGAPG